MLEYNDAIRLARGCSDYKGGYDGLEYAAYQEGIAFVARVLEDAFKDADQHGGTVLDYSDAVRLAKGCADHKDGYDLKYEMHETFREGIDLVVRVLERALEDAARHDGEISDSQLRAVHAMGRSSRSSLGMG